MEPTFGGIIVSQPENVLQVQADEDTGAYTFVDVTNEPVATVADPETQALVVVNPYSEYSVSASVVTGSEVTPVSSNTLDVTISTVTQRDIGYTGARVKIMTIAAPSSSTFSLAGTVVTDGLVY
jgi:hypothetical protein